MRCIGWIELCANRLVFHCFEFVMKHAKFKNVLECRFYVRISTWISFQNRLDFPHSQYVEQVYARSVTPFRINVLLFHSYPATSYIDSCRNIKPQRFNEYHIRSLARGLIGLWFTRKIFSIAGQWQFDIVMRYPEMHLMNVNWIKLE